MLTSIAKAIGGILGDATELAKLAVEEVTEIPQALQEGFNEGLMIDPEDGTKEEDNNIINPDKDEVEITL
jgi:hypothetical protein